MNFVSLSHAVPGTGVGEEKVTIWESNWGEFKFWSFFWVDWIWASEVLLHSCSAFVARCVCVWCALSGRLCFFVLESEWVSWASEWGSELRGLVGNYVAVDGARILTSDFWFAARTCSSCVLLLLSRLGPWAVPCSVYTSKGWPSLSLSLSLSLCLSRPQKNRTVLERNVFSVTFLIPVIICYYSEWDLSSELHI